MLALCCENSHFEEVSSFSNNEVSTDPPAVPMMSRHYKSLQISAYLLGFPVNCRSTCHEASAFSPDLASSSRLVCAETTLRKTCAVV